MTSGFADTTHSKVVVAPVIEAYEDDPTVTVGWSRIIKMEIVCSYQITPIRI